MSFCSLYAVYTFALVLLGHFPVRHFSVLQIPVLQIQLSLQHTLCTVFCIYCILNTFLFYLMVIFVYYPFDCRLSV